MHEASQGQTKLFIQLIDFLSIRRRPPVDKFFNRFLEIKPTHRQRLSEHYENEAWLSTSDTELREHLVSADAPGCVRVLGWVPPGFVQHFQRPCKSRTHPAPA